jgi:hypothetical protein
MLIASGLLALLIGVAFAVLPSSVADLRALEQRAQTTIPGEAPTLERLASRRCRPSSPSSGRSRPGWPTA